MKSYLLNCLFLALTVTGFSQEMGYHIFGTQTNPYSSLYKLITLDTINEAKTLSDIYALYRPSWVATYIGVKVACNCNGFIKSALGKNDTLTPEQLAIMRMAESDCSIDVEVDYIPNNTLQYNPPRKMEFSMRVTPIVEAKYVGGDTAMEAYLKTKIIDKISANGKEALTLAKVRFNISEQGNVSDAHIFTTSQDAHIDKLMLDAICNMPRWSPAKNADGEAITQEFEFSVGTDLLRCDYFAN